MCPQVTQWELVGWIQGSGLQWNPPYPALSLQDVGRLHGVGGAIMKYMCARGELAGLALEYGARSVFGLLPLRGSKIDTTPTPPPRLSLQRPLCGSRPLESWRLTLFSGALGFSVLFLFSSLLCPVLSQMDLGVWPLMRAASGQGPLMGCPLSHPRAVLAEGPAHAKPGDN